MPERSFEQSFKGESRMSKNNLNDTASHPRKGSRPGSEAESQATNAVQPSPCGRADKSLTRSGSDFRGGVASSSPTLPAWLPLPEFAVGLWPRQIRPSRKGRAIVAFVAKNRRSTDARRRVLQGDSSIHASTAAAVAVVFAFTLALEA